MEGIANQAGKEHPRLKRIAGALLFPLEVFATVVFSLLTLSVFLMVLDRFILHIGYPWTEELARFSFIWMGFLGAAIRVQNKGHFNSPYFVDKFLGNRSREILEIVITLLLIGMMAFVSVYAIKFALFTSPQISTTLRISMFYVNLSLPIGGAMMVIFWIIDLYCNVMKLKGSNEKAMPATG